MTDRDVGQSSVVRPPRRLRKRESEEEDVHISVMGERQYGRLYVRTLHFPSLWVMKM